MAHEFKKDKVQWTKAMNLHLAKYMEDKPNIWDSQHPKFSHMGFRDETFANFAAQYENLDWQAVKDRWTNIRSTYSFYMRKINARKSRGEDFKVGWFMWKPCKYLYKVHKPKTLKSTKDVADESEDCVCNDDNGNDDSMAYSDNSEDGADNLSCQGIVNNIATVFKDVKSGTIANPQSKYAAVGDAVTKMLSRLDSYEAAQMVQKISEILAEYDAKNPMNPNVLTVENK